SQSTCGRKARQQRAGVPAATEGGIEISGGGVADQKIGHLLFQYGAVVIRHGGRLNTSWRKWILLPPSRPRSPFRNVPAPTTARNDPRPQTSLRAGCPHRQAART